MTRRVVATALLSVLFVSVVTGQGLILPPSISPNEAEIRMTRTNHGGCPEPRCVYYRVTISGDGVVRFEDLAEPPVPERTRRVPLDQALALVNEFVRARFLEIAPQRYVDVWFYVFQDGQFVAGSSGGADATTWDLSFRLGSVQKSVHLQHAIPDYLARLTDLVDQLGGPAAWTVR